MSSTNKILISGYKSGFGKYAYSKLNKSKALNRDNRDEVLKSEYKTIIHSAFSSNRTDDINDYYDYVDSNILLTNDLVKCRHERFIYISSLVVHDKKDSLYKRTKLMAESIVKNKSSNYLIVRVPAMLGTSIRPNTVTKMIKEKNFKTTLSDKSTFNYILHSDLFDFIMDEKNNGVINFLSKNNINLKRVNEIVKGNTIFGDYVFQTEMVDGIKTRTSDEVIERYKKII